jgi:hypothetical protein
MNDIFSDIPARIKIAKEAVLTSATNNQIFKLKIPFDGVFISKSSEPAARGDSVMEFLKKAADGRQDAIWGNNLKKKSNLLRLKLQYDSVAGRSEIRNMPSGPSSTLAQPGRTLEN